jgi:hypothetical protein
MIQEIVWIRIFIKRVTTEEGFIKSLRVNIKIVH